MAFFVISGPSGVGKSSVIAEILSFYSNHAPLHLAISHTTRSARRKACGTWEVHARDYYFVSHARFLHLINDCQFLEYSKSYGNYYGTSKAEVQRLSGGNAIFDLDVHGGMKLKEAYPEKTHLIFLAPPSFQELESGLRNRNTDPNLDVRLDIGTVAEQMYIGMRYYNFFVINETNNINRAVADICDRIITPALNEVIQRYDPDFLDCFPIPPYRGLPEHCIVPPKKKSE